MPRAHAGEQYAIEIVRHKDPTADKSVLDVCRSALDGVVIQRLVVPP